MNIFAFQERGEAGNVFEECLLGGTIFLFRVHDKIEGNPEVKAVFFPNDGPCKSEECILKPSFISEFLKTPRKPIYDKDYTPIPATHESISLWSASDKKERVSSAESATPKRPGCRLHNRYASPLRRSCWIPLPRDPDAFRLRASRACSK